MNKKITKIIGIFTILMLVLTSCGSEKQADSGNTDDIKTSENEMKDDSEGDAMADISDTIVYGSWAAPDGVFNNLINDTSRDTDIIRMIYPALLKYDKELNLVPDFADSYEVSDDNLRITFKLKTGAKWTDGEPVSAEDVLFTFKSLADPKYSGSKYSMVSNLVGAKDYHDGKSTDFPGVVITGDDTVELVFESVYSPGLNALGTLSFIPKHIWEKEPIENWKTSKELLTNPVSSGLYTVKEFQVGQYVKLERNDDYYGNKAKTKNFIYKVVNQETSATELENGDIAVTEVTNLKNEEIQALKDKGLLVAKYQQGGVDYFGFNLRQERFQDVRVRQAFAYAMDRKSIIDKVLEGNATEVNVPMVPSLWSYPDTLKLNDYPFDPEKAKELLKEAGWANPNSEGYLTNDKGEILEFSFTFFNKPIYLKYIAPIIQQNLKDVGVKVNLEPLDWNQVLTKVVGNHDFDTYMMTNSLNPEPDPKPYWYSTEVSDVEGVYAWNIAAYQNPEADKLMDQGIATLDRGERKEIYQQFGEVMNHDLPWVYLFNMDMQKAYSPKLKGFDPGTFVDLNNVENWYLEQ